MEFELLTPQIMKEWDHLIYHSQDGWVFSLSSWLTMVTGVWSMENHSFAIRENGKLAAALPLNRIPMEKRLSSSGWGHGGPVISSDISSADRRRLWGACWRHVEDIANELRAAQITVSVSPICQSSLNSHWGVNPLIEDGFVDRSTHVRIVDLQQSQDELWFGLAKDARQKVNQARSAGYSVRRSSWSDMVDDYYRVHIENYQRTGVPPHPKAYFDGIASQPGNHFQLWVGYDPSGSPVAFHNDAYFNNAIMYHTGCSSTDHLKSGINYLLFWESILGAKANGCCWYETGEAFPQAKSGKDKGLTEFKSKFGGELHRLFRGEILIPDPSSGPLKNLAAGPGEIFTVGQPILHKFSGFHLGALSISYGRRIVRRLRKAALGIKNITKGKNDA